MYVCLSVCLSSLVCVPLFLSLSPVAPMIIEISPNQTVLAGDNVSFVCTANGNPPPIVQWMKDGLVYGSNGSSFPVTSTLDLESVAPADAGAYTCEASNDIGSSKLQSTLVVQGQYINMALSTIYKMGQWNLTHMHPHVLRSCFQICTYLFVVFLLIKQCLQFCLLLMKHTSIPASVTMTLI